MKKLKTALGVLGAFALVGTGLGILLSLVVLIPASAFAFVEWLTK